MERLQASWAQSLLWLIMAALASFTVADGGIAWTIFGVGAVVCLLVLLLGRRSRRL